MGSGKLFFLSFDSPLRCDLDDLYFCNIASLRRILELGYLSIFGRKLGGLSFSSQNCPETNIVRFSDFLTGVTIHQSIW